MIKIEHTDVYGWEAAIRGMRNPMNSWDKSDSHKCLCALDFGDCEMVENNHEPAHECDNGKRGFCVGINDLDLMKRLAKGGSVHAKYRRMITVTCDITAPLYWWKEFDTYKVGTVANSCSTMHKIHAKEFAIDDFSIDHLDILGIDHLKTLILYLNSMRDMFLETKNKHYWWQMIQLLPSSYNQKRTVQLNYEVLVGMYRDRRNHKLNEWHVFCDWIEALPYSELIEEVDNEQ